MYIVNSIFSLDYSRHSVGLKIKEPIKIPLQLAEVKSDIPYDGTIYLLPTR